ncbi:MAG TPA: hypothetical protein VI968_00395 [archaeon]|nr:hypothetical protein [archaeon]
MPYSNINPKSREYRVFKKEEFESNLPVSLYEKACNRAERIMRVRTGEKSRQKLQDTINFCHLRITPEGAMSLPILFLLSISLPTMLLLVLKIMGLPGLSFGYGIVIMLVTMFFTFYIYNYPYHYKSKYEMEAGAGIITLVLYMTMYMRNVPNLEGAVKFAAENIGDKMGYEIKKLLWDVEVGNYTSMQQAMLDYSNKWSKNKDFSEALGLLVTSLRQTGSQRLLLLDEAITRILDGSREQARHFNRQLRLPVMIVHALGIMLPIMGLVLFPIVSVFLGVESSILFVGYDIILPLILFFVISKILEIRPVTSSKIDLSDNPDIPPEGMTKISGKVVRAWPIALITGVAIVCLGAYLVNTEPLFGAVTITFGISIGIGLYYVLLASPRIKIRSDTRAVENEFSEALFQLGNQVSAGSPIEISIENSMERIQNLKIKDLFQKALDNMKSLGMTFEQSFFDKRFGAINYYPSKMIKSIIKTIVESSKKGVSTASIAMITVSRYLKNIHETNEEVNEQLSETVSSLKFQAYFLSPLVSGIIVTMAVIIIEILRELSAKVSDLPSAATGGAGLPSFLGLSPKITPFEFVFIVGIYIVETSMILGIFINSIENGEDKISYWHTTGTIMIISQVVFVIILFVSLMVFTPLVATVVG